jgi:2,3-bisphosphoglycerate-dependent phosphoglycerate mutase
VSAHGNSLRGIIKYLSNIGDEEIVGLEIPTGKPLVYELGTGLSVERHYYLGED